MFQLRDRVALVTGAGRGIGRAIAQGYAAAGAKVAITARSENELNEVGEMIRSKGGDVYWVKADLVDRSAPANIVRQVSEHYGPIDILVNNAGVGSSINPKQFIDFDDATWDLSLAINLTAPYLLCKLVLPDMVAKQYGRIIMTASISSKSGCVHGVAYAASKHGLLGVTRTLALEMAGEGITVNAICPGPVRTKMNSSRVAYDADRLGVSIEQHEAAITPIGRRLEPEEIAPLALYLASDEAATVTGQGFNIDGGLLTTA